MGSVSANDENRPEFQLKRYDYFGYGSKLNSYSSNCTLLFKYFPFILL